MRHQLGLIESVLVEARGAFSRGQRFVGRKIRILTLVVAFMHLLAILLVGTVVEIRVFFVLTVLIQVAALHHQGHQSLLIGHLR